MKIRRMKPLSVKRMNLLLGEVSDMQVVKLDNGELVLEKVKDDDIV